MAEQNKEIREKVSITIKKSIWKALSQLKLNRDFKTFDEVLEYLLKK